nr:hypothetical protein [Tanacetum cinerariifolium]
ALLALHLAHPPLPRYDGPPPARALSRGRQERARRASGGGVQALVGPRKTGRQCRARQHQIQAGRVHRRAHWRAVQGRGIGPHRARHLRRD